MEPEIQEAPYVISVVADRLFQFQGLGSLDVYGWVKIWSVQS